MLRDIAEARDFIRDRTTISADMAYSRHGISQVVVIGRYRSADYVEIFTLGEQELSEIIEHLKSMRKFGKFDRIDAPRGVRAVFDNELKRF